MCASKKLQNYEPDYNKQIYTEGTISINMDMKENKPMKDFTIQDQIEDVLGVAMAQVYSLKNGLKEFGQDGKMQYNQNCNITTIWTHIFRWTQAN